jgi:hypothetical protein
MTSGSLSPPTAAAQARISSAFALVLTGLPTHNLVSKTCVHCCWRDISLHGETSIHPEVVFTLVKEVNYRLGRLPTAGDGVQHCLGQLLEIAYLALLYLADLDLAAPENLLYLLARRCKPSIRNLRKGGKEAGNVKRSGF